MDNGNFQFPANAGYPYSPNAYEPLKEEMEVGVLSSSRPQGATVASTVVNVTSYDPQPRDHLIWSIFNTVYMNFCCLGFMALVFSIKARDRKLVGDIGGAISYGSTAKCLNITALVLMLVSFILIIVLLATGVIVANRMHEQINQNLFGPGYGK